MDSKNGEEITIPYVLALTAVSPNKTKKGKIAPLRLSYAAQKRREKIVAEDMPFRKAKITPKRTISNDEEIRVTQMRGTITTWCIQHAKVTAAAMESTCTLHLSKSNIV